MSRLISAPGHRSHRSGRTLTPLHARPAMSGSLRVVRETLVIALAALLYFWVRGLMHTQIDLAFANAETLIALEQRLGIFHEPWLQDQVLRRDWLVTFANRIYIFGHWPLIAATMTWLIWKHRDQFALYRSALLLSGAIGLICFLFVPMAPPRFMVEQGFVDTVMQNTEAYRVLQPPAFTNQYAAMPSLHVGWNLLMGIAIVRCATSWWVRGFGVLMPVVMYLSTIVTANHYLLDGVAGSAIALLGLALAWQISRPGHAPTRVEPLPERPRRDARAGHYPEAA